MILERLQKIMGKGQRSKDNGEFKYQQTSSLPYGLGDLIKRLDVGQITKPLRMNQWFCIIELMERNKSVLDDNTKEELLAGQLLVWVAAVVKQIEE